MGGQGANDRLKMRTPPRSLLKGIGSALTIQECTVKQARQRGFGKNAFLNTHGSPVQSRKRSKRQSCAARIVAMGNKCGQCFVSVRCRMSTSHGIRAHSSEGTSALPDRMGSTGVGAHLSPKLLNETLLPMHHISGRARSISSWPWLTN